VLSFFFVLFFNFDWLLPLSAADWLLAGLALKPQFPVSAEKGYLVVFLQRNFKRNLCLLWNVSKLPKVRFVYLLKQCNDQPQRDARFEPLLEPQYPVGRRPVDNFAADRSGNVSRRGF